MKNIMLYQFIFKKQPHLWFGKKINKCLFIFMIMYILVPQSGNAQSGNIQAVSEQSSSTKGLLKELVLNKKNESQNLKIAAEAETMISRSEEQAIKQLEVILIKYKGSTEEPDLLFRLAELQARRAKTGRFVDLYRGEKTLAEILTPKLTEKGAKAYLSQAITIYQSIQKKFPHYLAMDEVLFNEGFAHEQRGEADLAERIFLEILEKFPNSNLNPEVNMALGELFFQKQNYSASQKHYENVQKWPNSQIAPIALYKSAWCSYNLKKSEEALNKMELVLDQSKSQPLVSHVRSEAIRDLALFYSELNSAENSINYFKNHLLEDEIGNTVLELSSIYERHGKITEMDLVLSLFLKTYPEAESSGLVLLKRFQIQNDLRNTSVVIESAKGATRLCKNESWTKKSKATHIFCNETLQKELKEVAAEWWSAWNQLGRPKEISKINQKNNSNSADLLNKQNNINLPIPDQNNQQLTLDTDSWKAKLSSNEMESLFNEYLKNEEKNNWDIGIHMSYADFLFSMGNFKFALIQYQGVSQIEKLDPVILHDAIYGTIVCLDRQLKYDKKDKFIQQELLVALNNYITICPNGQFLDEVKYKKAFIFFENKDYSQSIEWTNKISSTNQVMNEKKEDLLIEIYNAKKNFSALVEFCLKILKTSKGERAKKIKYVYQNAEKAIVQNLIDENNFEIAAEKSKSYYFEHTPEASALEALHLSIELREKTKKFRLAAEESEILAKEWSKQKNFSKAEQLSQHAAQLFLQLGDLERTKKSLSLAIELTLDPQKKKESLELLAEISIWYGDVNSVEKAWSILELEMSNKEKQELLMSKLKFYHQQAPEKETLLKANLIQKQIEPYYSDSLISTATKLCSEKKWNQCYQLAIKLNRDSSPLLVRLKARALQAQVLLNEYEIQGISAPPDRLSLVLSYKAEKFDKAVQLLNSISQKSEDTQIRIKAIEDLIGLYKNYVTLMQKIMLGLPDNLQDLTSLKHELSQILPVLLKRPKELEDELFELRKMAKQSDLQSINKGESAAFPELNGRELRVYLPTWEDAISNRPINEITVSSKSCIINTINKLNTLSALGREANSCLIKKKYNELEIVSLRISDLFPATLWGPYYLSISASLQNSSDRARWYLELANKRTKDDLLKYEEARQTYRQYPNPVTVIDLLKFENNWNQIEEIAFLETLDNLKKQKCELAQTSILKLRSLYWKSTPIEKLYVLTCPIKKPDTITLRQ